MNINRIRVFGFEPALIGMRNPMDSWMLSDSTFYEDGRKIINSTIFGPALIPEMPNIGEKDINLACKLIKRGNEHRKFLRQIIIWIEITAPRFLWQEIDTYKVATVRNSCSTMNKICSTNIRQVDFEEPINANTIQYLNQLGELFRKATEKKNRNELRTKIKNNLPEGYLQKSMYMMNYETALSMIIQRENHRLNQWKEICDFLKNLPYMNLFYEAAMGNNIKK